MPRKPILLVTGQPHRALTRILESISAQWNVALISPETLLTAVVEDRYASSEDSVAKKIKEKLLLGSQCSVIDMISILEEALKSDWVLARGAIVYGMFECLNNPQEAECFVNMWTRVKNEGANDGFVSLSAQLLVESFNSVSGSESFYWIDPLTRIEYDVAQVERTKNALMSFTNDDDDGEDDQKKDNEDEEENQDEQKDSKEEQSEDEEGDDDEDEVEEFNPPVPTNYDDQIDIKEEEQEETKEKKEVVEKVEKVEEPLIPKEIFQRLVIYKDLFSHQKYNSISSFVKLLHESHSSPQKLVFDFAQPEKDLKECISQFVARNNLVPINNIPIRLTDAIENLSEDQALARHLTVEADEEYSIPKRTLSRFGRHCPVTFFEQKKFENGRMSNAVAYNNRVYYFTNEAMLRKFLACPDKYIDIPDRKSGLKVLLMGLPLSGKSTQAKLLSKYLKVIDCQKLTEDEKIASDIFEKGNSFNFDHLLLYLSKNRETGVVIDGMVENADQLKQICNSGWKPDCIFYLKYSLDQYKVRYEKQSAFFRDGVQRKEENVFQTNQGFPVDQPKNDSSLTFKDFSFEAKFPVPDEQLQALASVCQDHEIQLELIDANKISYQLNYEICTMIDKLTPSPNHVLLPEDGCLTNPSFAFGKTRDYCPVTLFRRGVLKKGETMFGAQYKDEVYMLSNKDSLDLFTSSPDYYLNYDDQIKPPPIRICCVGPRSSGKKTICHSFFDSYKVAVIEYVSLLKQYGKDHPENDSFIQLFLTDDNGTLPEEIFVEIFNDLFTKKGNFVLLGCPKTRKEAEMLFQYDYIFDAIIHLSIESTTYLARNLQKRVAELKTQMEASDKADSIEELAKTEVNESYEKEYERTEEIAEYFRNSRIQRVDGDGNRSIRWNIATLKKLLNPFVEYRDGLFLNPVKCKNKKAKEFLKIGCKKISLFQNYCPVEYKKTGVLKAIGDRPVVLGNNIYYLLKKNVSIFLQNAHAFVSEPLKAFPTMPKVLVVGAPMSGKSSLAKRLAEEMNLEYVDVGTAIDAILNGVDRPLKEDMMNILCQGKVIDPKTASKALLHFLNKKNSLSNGWVLVLPAETNEDIKLIEALSPISVILLDSDIENFRSEKEGEYIFELGSDLNRRFLSFKEKKHKLVEIFSDKRNILSVLDSKNSLWFNSDSAKKFVQYSLAKHQYYVQRGNSPCSLKGLGIPKDILAERTSGFGFYCPVTFLNHDELWLTEEISDQFAVEFKGKYYFLKNDECVNLFLDVPQKYLETHLPEDLPVKMNVKSVSDIFPRGLECKGYCPVSFVLHKELVKGKLEYLVEYKKQLYVFKDPLVQLKFLSQPSKYIDITLPYKLPPPVAPINIQQLPLVGYLEQSVASVIQKALVNIGKTRPCRPYEHPQFTAVNYLALYLKANNPNVSQEIRSMYQARIDSILVQSSQWLKLIDTVWIGGFVPAEKRDDLLQNALRQFDYRKKMKSYGEIDEKLTKTQINQ